jgi:hypothetical protein
MYDQVMDQMHQLGRIHDLFNSQCLNEVKVGSLHAYDMTTISTFSQLVAIQ